MTTQCIKLIEPSMFETDRWLRYLRSQGRKENTLRTHRSNVRQCLRTLQSAGRPTKAALITTDDIQFLWRTLDVKEEVRHAYLRSLAGMIEYHTKIDVVKRANILHNRETCDRVFITKDEFSLAYAAADEQQKLILCLGAYMGLRRAEMAEIRDPDIEGDTMVIHGKGHGDEGLVARVRIPAPVMAAIEGYRGSAFKMGRRKDDYLLQTRDKKLCLHAMPLVKISDSMTALGKQLGFRITTHSLRRFYATMLYYETGSDLQTLKNMMRHADVSTTLRCYVDAYDQKEREASEKLTDLINNLVGMSKE